MSFIVEHAKIVWRGNTPFSAEYQDVYFSSAGEVEETQTVFLGGNGLPARWQNTTSFTIAETGFGTGLNFLVTLQQWAQLAPSDSRLSFISIEKTPLALADLKRAVSAWPQLKPYSDALIAAYPECVAGFHRRWFLNNRVALTLIFADVAHGLNVLNPAKVDAWYLDGFAPSRNPKMWNVNLFRHMASLSAPKATFSTYTAAGVVRRNLESAGFHVEKRPGFAGKRERLEGYLLQKEVAEIKAPWFHYEPDNSQDKVREAIIIGGGISGACVAHSLVKRGWRVTLLERHTSLALEASGNLAGVVMPRLSLDMNMASQFFLSAFLHCVHWLDDLKRDTLRRANSALPWFKSGVLSLCAEKKAEGLMAWHLPDSVLHRVSCDEASALCGIKVKQGGICFPQAGYLDPVGLIEQLVASVDVVCDVSVKTIEHVDGQWRLSCENGREFSAATVVFANGYDAMQLLGADYLALSKVRGQLSYLAESALKATLAMPVCTEGYIIPLYKNRYCVGATYHTGDLCGELRSTDHAQNLAQVSPWLVAGFSRSVNVANEGRVAWRAATVDYLPYVGPVPDVDFYRQSYVHLRHGRPANHYPHARYQPGLWLISGMGSRGLVSAPYCAELLSDLMNNSPLCASQEICQSLHPARHLIRQLKKGDFNENDKKN